MSKYLMVVGFGLLVFILNAQESYYQEEEESFFTEISTTKENQECGSIKYSVLNLGEISSGDWKENIKITAFNEKGQAVFEGDSISVIKLACKDITNDSSPELIIDTWGGGNCGCCNEFHILTSKLSGRKSHPQVLLSGEGFRGIKDEDSDGVSEVTTCQWTDYGINGNVYLNQTKCLRGDKYVDCASKSK
jgi:hypothetical protein